MSDVFVCVDEARRRRVAASTTHNGIDFLEVDPADQRVLLVHFLHPLPGQQGGVPTGPPLEPANVVIEGGERITSFTVLSVTAADDVLTVTVDQPGDFSTYRLRLVAGDDAPAGFDPVLTVVSFSFKVTCPNPFDCRPRPVPPAQPPAPVALDYLAKDYDGFRRLMLDRLGTLMPAWTDRGPADPVVALVELLAHVGDQQSYLQDAVATEAYLGTARSRISVRRHARLLDYAVRDGCNARAWVAIDVASGSDSDGFVLPAGTPALLGAATDAPTVTAAEALASSGIVFETVHPLTLVAPRSRIDIHTWSAEEYCLPAGTTGTTLVDTGFSLAVGDVLLFEEIASPETGLAADADPAHRQAVRLISVRKRRDPIENLDIVDVTWHQADALAFSLPVLATPAPGEPPVRTAEVRGNVVLADHGLRVRAPLPTVETDRYRPVLPGAPVSQAEPYPPAVAATRPAADVLVRSPGAALPQVTLLEGDDTWVARADLLGSDRFDRAFVVEIERDGTARLRFGDDVYGRRPVAGTALTAEFRIGNGPDGNVGHDTLRRLVWDRAGITGVTNPLPGAGGQRPESIDEIREFAPQAFRVQQRAVTEADWERVAGEHPEVQRAKARFRWTGSWYTVFLTIDRFGGGPVVEDPVFLSGLLTDLERFRIAGYDLEITGPTYVPLELSLRVCVRPEYFRSDVEQALLDAFSNRGSGFFSPDNFTFGQPLYLSEIDRVAMAVPGVSFVEITEAHRFGRAPAGELAAGIVTAGALEVIRLDNDPSLPERGQLHLDMQGGL
jgi:hypothetical protein